MLSYLQGAEKNNNTHYGLMNHKSLEHHISGGGLLDINRDVTLTITGG